MNVVQCAVTNGLFLMISIAFVVSHHIARMRCRQDETRVALQLHKCAMTIITFLILLVIKQVQSAVLL